MLVVRDRSESKRNIGHAPAHAAGPSAGIEGVTLSLLAVRGRHARIGDYAVTAVTSYQGGRDREIRWSRNIGTSAGELSGVN